MSTAAALSLAMAVPGSAAYQPEQKFQDVSRSASYYEDVMDANYYGLMAGVSGKTFDTESTITRAMWVTMLYKMAGQPAVQSKDTFTDVKTGDWFAQAATWAVEQGITAGYEDGSFGVNQTITRQEMAVMASKFAAQYKDAAVSASGNLAGYADAGELDSWASEAMSWALSSGVMQAVDGKLSPKSTVSRANTAGVAVRLYELGGVDLDTITALEKDWTQAAQLPLTGWFTKNIDVEGDRQVTVYISEEASIRSYFTVIAVPNGVDTQQFLEDEGWIDLMDQKGEALFVLEPGAEGWGSAAEEKAYMDAAIAFLKSGRNEAGINVFSTFGEFYLAGYGEGAAPLEAWAAENPIFVISQAFVNAASAGKAVLEEAGSVLYDGSNTSGYDAGFKTDAEFQAVIPVRGKILNCLKASYDKIFKSEIITNLIKVLGCGVEVKTKANKQISTFNLDNLRWNKIVICTDADEDGFQIRTLILTMIQELCPTLIEKGYVYIAESPLYEINTKDRTYFAYTEPEKTKILGMIGDAKYTIQRSKGLGENDPDMMSLTTMNPDTRRLIKVNPTDLEATREMFDVLLGNDLEGRKRFIKENGSRYLAAADIS